MILQKKDEIFNWLQQYDREYLENIENNAYELIDLHDYINQSLLNEMIQKDNLADDYFEKLKLKGHQYILNIMGSVNFLNKKIKSIPLQFYHVSGDFYCGNNDLKSLKGCPHIVGESFYCHGNRIKSLEHCPQFILGDFWCNDNELKSLEYCSHFVEGNFFCYKNKLTSLEYFPETIDGYIFLYNNPVLLKYKNQSIDINIQNMSDDDFLEKRDFQFWHQFHLQEKTKNENEQILDDLILNDNIQNSDLIKAKIKKL